jgi:flagellar basal-body rod protein FlgG
MLRALDAAASGMQAQELRTEVIANNLANVSTTGFKRQRAEFQDLMYETLRPAGTTNANGNQVPTGVQVGDGVRTVATLREFHDGALKQTDNSLDLAIEGAGFFQIRLPSGEMAYSRDGSMKLDSQGRVVNADGYELEPRITIPANTTSIAVATDGTVSVTTAGNTTTNTEVGKIQLATFTNPSGLNDLGRNLYVPTPAAGDPVITTPGTEATGTLSQGMLEMSNVTVVDEMVDLISAQRAYETNSKVIQAADQMLQTTANLR